MSALPALPGQARAGDWTHSLPVVQLRVAKNSELDTEWIKQCIAKREAENVFHPFGTNLDPGTLGVVPGEIAIANREFALDAKAKQLYQDNRGIVLPSHLTKSYTNLNGYFMPEDVRDKPAEIIQYEIHKRIRVTGIVGAACEWEVQVQKLGRTDFANQIGGVCGIINTSDKNIYAGQLVVARVPLKLIGANLNNHKRKNPISGTDGNKILMSTEPYDPSQIITIETLKVFAEKGTPEDMNNTVVGKFVKSLLTYVAYCDAVIHGAFVGGVRNVENVERDTDASLRAIAANPALYSELLHPSRLQGREIVTSLMTTFFEIQHEYNRCVIGVALSDAVPEQQFDLKQGSYAN
jgi:hypothetical protein